MICENGKDIVTFLNKLIINIHLNNKPVKKLFFKFIKFYNILS